MMKESLFDVANLSTCLSLAAFFKGRRAALHICLLMHAESGGCDPQAEVSSLRQVRFSPVTALGEAPRAQPGQVLDGHHSPPQDEMTSMDY